MRLISEAPALTKPKKTKKTLIHIKKTPLLDDTHDIACLRRRAGAMVLDLCQGRHLRRN